MRVLVVGGTGHIGSYLVPRLVMGGHEVLVVARNPQPQYTDPRIAWPKVEWVVADRRAEEAQGAWKARMEGIEVNVVCDLICYTPEQHRLMVEAFDGRVSHFLHCGTIWAYGPPGRVPYEEHYPRKPLGDYGRMKAEIEADLIGLYQKTGFPATIIHPGHISGRKWLPIDPQGTRDGVGIYRKLALGEVVHLPKYGRETLHRRYGVANAVNIGDYLIGLGYRLVASAKAECGEGCIADLLEHLSQAHMKLCRGQGAELLMAGTDPLSVRPLDVLATYALKTAPAFEVALASGARMARCTQVDPDLIRTFCRSIGVAYQTQNDLDDWKPDRQNKLVAGQDALSGRPTILQAFALQAGDTAANRELLDLLGNQAPDESVLLRLREAYQAQGAFGKARRLVDKYRSRAADIAHEVEPAVMGDLMRFIVDVLL